MTEARSSIRDEQLIYAEEALVVDAQGILQHLLDERGMSRADLARAMGVSRARVSQLFSDECKNFTIRLWARALFALGEEAVVSYAGSEDCLDHYLSGNRFQHDDEEMRSTSEWDELQSVEFSGEDLHANDNVFGGLAVMRDANAEYGMAA